METLTKTEQLVERGQSHCIACWLDVSIDDITLSSQWPIQASNYTD